MGLKFLDSHQVRFSCEFQTNQGFYPLDDDDCLPETVMEAVAEFDKDMDRGS